MNWEAIGALGEVFGGIAVLATLVYLARQVSSAEKMMRAETRNRRLNDARDLNYQMMQKPEIVEAINRIGNRLDDDLEQEDYQIWMNYISSCFLQMQADFELHRDEIFDDEDLDKFVRIRLADLTRARPRTALAWERTKRSYPEQFVKLMDAEFKKISSTTNAT